MIVTLGVDPGVHGGLAGLAPDGRVLLLRALKPSMTESELCAIVSGGVNFLRLYGEIDCYFEKVGYIGRRKDGKKDGGKGAFTFGGINGLLRGMLLTHGVTPRYVAPTMWQAAMECLSGGDKNVTKDRAQALFPYEKVTHATADALLIAEFGRRRGLKTVQLPNGGRIDFTAISEADKGRGEL